MKRSSIRTYFNLALMGTAIVSMAMISGMGSTASAAGPEDAPPLNELQTQLEDGLAGANLRLGPGLEFEVTGTVYDDDSIRVTGRTGDYWLRVEVEGQSGWLAGDLVEDQTTLALLPEVDANAPVAPTSTVNSNTYYGTGTQWTRDDNPVVTSIVEGGPGEQAGVQIGDVLLAVDGQGLNSEALRGRVFESIRGEKGTPVTLTLLRPSTTEVLNITIVRDEINRSKVSWSCAAEPIRGFGEAWENHPETHELLGCPFTNFRRDEHATRAAVQTFEGGWMLWLETDTVANVDPIYVFFADDGFYARYGDQPLVDANSYAPTEPGFAKVGDRFAKIYWERLDEQGRQRLGRPTNEARDSAGAFQEFERGRMFWAGEADTIYVIYAGDYDFDGDGKFEWKQGWLSYEDTYEAVEP